MDIAIFRSTTEFAREECFVLLRELQAHDPLLFFRRWTQ